MKTEDITPLVLTFNEAPNIGRCLARLAWARRVVVLDSFSEDDTIAIARSFPNVEVCQRRFDNHTDQWNHGVGLVATPWVLSLDADYVLEDALVEELRRIEPRSGIAAYFARFRYCVHGRPLRGSLYPPRAVLFQCALARYVDDGHTQLLEPAGATAFLAGAILHDDRKPLAGWAANQVRYARLEAVKLLGRPREALSRTDRLRLTGFLGPLLVLPYCLVVRRGALDGWPGFYYALQRLIAESLLCLFLLERRWRAGEERSGQPKSDG